MRPESLLIEGATTKGMRGKRQCNQLSKEARIQQVLDRTILCHLKLNNPEQSNFPKLNQYQTTLSNKQLPGVTHQQRLQSSLTKSLS